MNKKTYKVKKKEKGITLIALVVTIIVLLILAAISITMLTGDNSILNQTGNAKNETEKASAREELELEVLGSYDSALDLNLDKIKSNCESRLGATVTKDDDSLLVKYKGYIFLVDDEGNVTPFDTITKTLSKSKVYANEPKLTEGMIPVKFDTNKNKWIICEKNDSEWYDYGDKKWANVMLSDGKYKSGATVGTEVKENELGSMFVWIPRYAYSITKYKTSANDEGKTQKITDVSYLVGTTNIDKDGNNYKTDYDVSLVSNGNSTPKITHPAFTFGGTKLTGIWMAKFEASMAEENKNTTTDNNVTTKIVKILPNADSWRYINVGNSFLNCLNMKNNNIYGLSSSADTHLMKNIEWGAIAYLAGSQYGITPTINNNGSTYTENSTTKYHAYTGGNDYKANVRQSTTGNETGIYDLNGGNYERVAAYWDNGNSYLSGQGTSTVFPSNTLNSAYAKYWDRYEVSQNEITQMNNGLWSKDASANSIRKEVTDDRYNLMKNIKGDAMYEIINTYSYYGKNSSNTYTWLLTETDTSTNYGRSYYNSDLALIGNSSLPFLCRGGYWSYGTTAGVFNCSGSYGGANHNNGFRPVLAVL